MNFSGYLLKGYKRVRFDMTESEFNLLKEILSDWRQSKSEPGQWIKEFQMESRIQNYDADEMTLIRVDSTQ